MRDGATVRPTSDAGVSSVVGAILVAGLLVITLITIRTSFVPVWEEEAERGLMDQVTSQLGQLKGDMDRHVGNRSATAVTTTVSMGREAAGFFRVEGTPNQLEFEPGDKPVRFFADRIRFLSIDGSRTSSIDEDWRDYSGLVLENVSRTADLGLRMDSVSAADHGDSVTVQITDAAGDPAGSLQIRVERFDMCPGGGSAVHGYRVLVTTRTAGGSVLYDQPILVMPGQPGDCAGSGSDAPAIADFRVDALAPSYRFKDLLGAAAGPYALTFTHSDLPGDAAATYVVEDQPGGMRILVGGGGPVETGFARTYAGGTLTYRAFNTYFVNQEYVLENGALVIDQTDGAFLRSAPKLDAARIADRGAVRLSVPSLVGDRATTAGEGTVSVATGARAHSSFVAEVPDFSFNVTTRFPALWSQLWFDELEESNLDEGLGEFTITTGANWANLTVSGPTTDPASTELDVTVTLRRAAVDVQIKE